MNRLFFGIIFTLLILAPSHTPEARVTGKCNDCHTMHNSQNGSSMITGYNPVGGPYGTLLRANGCLGCHASTVASTWQGIGDAPVVFNTTGPDYGNDGLAAGNFFYVKNDGNAYGHNVEGISGVIFQETPPGYGSGKADIDGNTPGGNLSNWSGQQVTCAGYYGCHGRHNSTDDTNMKGMKGAHHGDEGTGSYRDGTTLSKSYRFLNGIQGVEDAEWEHDPDTAHNWYKGATDFDTTKRTISYLCAECHADYYASAMAGAASHWKRHPSDEELSETQGSSSYSYHNNAPVAYTDPTDPPAGTAVVMCLSCHRAHASPYGSNVPMFRGSNAIAVCNKCHNQ